MAPAAPGQSGSWQVPRATSAASLLCTRAAHARARNCTLISGLEDTRKHHQASAQRAPEPWTRGHGRVQSSLCNATPSSTCHTAPPSGFGKVSGLGEGQARDRERRTYLRRVGMKLEALGQKWGPLGPVNCPADGAGQPSSGSKGIEWHLGGLLGSRWHIASPLLLLPTMPTSLLAYLSLFALTPPTCPPTRPPPTHITQRGITVPNETEPLPDEIYYY